MSLPNRNMPGMSNYNDNPSDIPDKSILASSKPIPGAEVGRNWIRTVAIAIIIIIILAAIAWYLLVYSKDISGPKINFITASKVNSILSPAQFSEQSQLNLSTSIANITTNYGLKPGSIVAADEVVYAGHSALVAGIFQTNSNSSAQQIYSKITTSVHLIDYPKSYSRSTYFIYTTPTGYNVTTYGVVGVDGNELFSIEYAPPSSGAPDFTANETTMSDLAKAQIDAMNS